MAAVSSAIRTRLKRCRISSTFLGAARLGWPRCRAQYVVNLRSTFSRMVGTGPSSHSTERTAGEVVLTVIHRSWDGFWRGAFRPWRGLRPNPRPGLLMLKMS